MEISYEKILHRPMGGKLKVIVFANVSPDGCDWSYRVESYELDGWVDPIIRAKSQGREENYVDYVTPEEAFEVQQEFWKSLKPKLIKNEEA
ncbi:hypothetical protein [Dyadobacter frigoris]|uniref:Uncharacterized protein n=1 Tax=Dyadobacter frigoris TaxID=2576211 RepID=A0A4U6CZF0_9BACT|nr:hypothetical protein [Dyadobacter frigoris]TKT90250.1 hypothetical protein FDK13_21165 [Dyadobacter frigoris]GLU52486.1 hypothetical protein Dfri01_19470 [Dyadobacter frigoris]